MEAQYRSLTQKYNRVHANKPSWGEGPKGVGCCGCRGGVTPKSFTHQFRDSVFATLSFQARKAWASQADLRQCGRFSQVIRHIVGIYRGGFFELIRVTFFNFEGVLWSTFSNVNPGITYSKSWMKYGQQWNWFRCLTGKSTVVPWPRLLTSVVGTNHRYRNYHNHRNHHHPLQLEMLTIYFTQIRPQQLPLGLTFW